MKFSDTQVIPQMAHKIDTTNLRACAGLFASLQKILEELWKIHAM